MKRTKAKATRTRPLALGYLRVSTDEQADSGAGLAAQESTLRLEAERRGWDLQLVTDAGVSGGVPADQRPGLGAALEALEAGQADALMVAKLDRMSRSAADGASIMERAQQQGWSLVSLDLGIDTSTPTGEVMANVMLSFARLEKRLISDRTKAALAAKRAAGVRLGRPSSLSDEVVARIISERDNGATLQGIADTLNAEGIPTARGAACWTHPAIRKVLLGQQAARLRTAV